MVGGGTAGAVVARRLAEDSDAAVALVEAGTSDEGDERVGQLRRSTANTVYHPTDTCGMGAPDDPMAVVDPLIRSSACWSPRPLQDPVARPTGWPTTSLDRMNQWPRN